MLISTTTNGVKAQSDTLKKPIADTLVQENYSDELEDNVVYAAEDSVVALPQGGKAFLYGKANVSYGNMNMQAEVIEIDYNKSLVTAYGKKDSLGKSIGSPVFKDGDQTMEAEKIMYNLKTKRGKIFSALTKQGEMLVVGKEIKKDSTNVIYFKDMKCIPCQDADARTAFRATKAKVIPNDKIITGPMYLEIGGVPTPLGLPFGYFPNTKSKHNGVLFPTFGTSATLGYNLRNGGYYWGINDRADMIVRGDVYANGSWAINTINNYNVLYKSNGSLALGYTQFNTGDRDIPAQFAKRISNEVRWIHNQDNRNNPTVRFSANVNVVTNQTYQRLTAENTQDFLQSTFMSNINFTKSFKFSSLSLNATHSQNAQTKQMDIVLPSLTYNVNRFYPLKRENAVKQNVLDKLGVSYSAVASNKLSGKENTILDGSPLDSMQYGIQHTLPISTSFNILKYITASPALNLSSVMYPSSIRKEFYTQLVRKENGDTIVHGLRNKVVREPAIGYNATFSTGFSSKLYFDYLFRTGKLKQVRHVMIPTLTYSYRPDFGDEKFGFWKKVQKDTAGNTQYYSIFEKGIYGGPGRGKSNSLGISLYNTVDAKLKQKTDTGVTFRKATILQNLTLGTNYNFAADSFKLSDVSIGGQTLLFKNLNLNASSVFSPYRFDKTGGRLVDQFYYHSGRGLARFTRADIAVNTVLSSNMIEAAKKLQKPPSLDPEADKEMSDAPAETGKVDWTITLGYNLALVNPNDTKIHPTHALSVTARVEPTKFWKIDMTTGFDFTTQKASTTRFAIYRDLKCWEAHIDWVPFGVWKSYNIGINLKASMFSELKFKWPKTPAVQ